MNPIILDLCGGTGAWSRPYAEAEYDVRIIDPLVNGQDVRLFRRLDVPVHGILAAPPCTVFAGSGAKWKALRPTSEVLEGLSVVDSCIRIIRAHTSNDLKFWAVENPIGWLRDYLGPPDAYFDPCDYGDPYTKRTCLWGKFRMPERCPVEPSQGSKMHLQYGGRSGKTKTMRSVTPPGFARAFFEVNP